MNSITKLEFNTIAKLASRSDKPLLFHVSLYINSDKQDTYSLYFTYDDINFDYVQTGKGRRKTYKTLDDAYQDVVRVDMENAVMLVTSEHNVIDHTNWNDDD